MTLVEVLADPSRRQQVVQAGARLVEAEVARKSGLSGAAIKGGFATVRRLHPAFVERAMGVLMPEFAPRIDPLYAEARRSGDVAAWFGAHAGEIADALLAVTDARAAGGAHPLLVRVYRGLRGRAREHVIEAVPGLAQLVLQHVP